MIVYLQLNSLNKVIGYVEKQNKYTQKAFNVEYDFSNSSLTSDEFFSDFTKYKLQNGQLVVDEQTLEDREINQVKDYLAEVRIKRKPYLKAFDILNTNRLSGITVLSDTKWLEILNWRQAWLNLPQTVDTTKTLEEQLPVTPEEIEYYIS